MLNCLNCSDVRKPAVQGRCRAFCIHPPSWWLLLWSSTQRTLARFRSRSRLRTRCLPQIAMRTPKRARKPACPAKAEQFQLVNSLARSSVVGEVGKGRSIGALALAGREARARCLRLGRRRRASGRITIRFPVSRADRRLLSTAANAAVVAHPHDDRSLQARSPPRGRRLGHDCLRWQLQRRRDLVLERRLPAERQRRRQAGRSSVKRQHGRQTHDCADGRQHDDSHESTHWRQRNRSDGSTAVTSAKASGTSDAASDD